MFYLSQQQQKSQSVQSHLCILSVAFKMPIKFNSKSRIYGIYFIKCINEYLI